MLYSCSKYDIDLKNKYALKAFFILNRYSLESYNNLNAIIVASITHPSSDDINLDTLYVSSDSITFHLKIEDMIWYKLICHYENHCITSVSEYLRKYSDFEDCWTEIYNYENNNLVNEYRTCIKALVKTCFRRIKTQYINTDSDMIDSPWFYNNMKSFEQMISLQAQTHLRKYVNSIKNQLLFRTYYNSKLKKRILHSWKEWYYFPENGNGYIKKLRINYENNQ